MAPPVLVIAASALLGPVRGGVAAPPRLPALERVLARGAVTEASGTDGVPGPASAALAALGCPPDASGLATPAAPADLPGERAAAWLRADPVHLRADQDRLLLYDAGTLDLTASEAEALASAAAEAFAPLGARLLAPHPARWYLALGADPGLETLPPWAVAGRDLAPGLPAGPEAADWRRALTEAQMLLHAHPANAARAAGGRPVANGVWLWGVGPPPAPVRRFAAVWSAQPEVRGLAGAAGMAVHEPPAAFGPWLDGAGPGEHLVDLGGRGAWTAAYGDEAGWRGWAEAAEEAWVAPALAALGAGCLAALELATGDGRRWRLDRGGLRRFWRRPRPLSAWLA